MFQEKVKLLNFKKFNVYLETLNFPTNNIVLLQLFERFALTSPKNTLTLRSKIKMTFSSSANSLFPSCMPRLVDPLWFKVDAPQDENAELQKLEKDHAGKFKCCFKFIS